MGPETPQRMGAPADGERDIVTSGAIVITAAIGTNAVGRAYPGSALA